jgi:hypothetical protein
MANTVVILEKPEKRSAKFSVAFTPSEYAEVERYCEENGWKYTDFIRKAVLYILREASKPSE